jgi:hypothetical protein
MGNNEVTDPGYNFRLRMAESVGVTETSKPHPDLDTNRDFVLDVARRDRSVCQDDELISTL